jgi:ATP-dependent DNA helicase RecG
LRDPLVADALYLSRDIEKWSSGPKRIFEECMSRDVKVEFRPLKTGFMTIFHRGLAKEEKLGENEEKILLMSSSTIPRNDLKEHSNTIKGEGTDQIGSTHNYNNP